MRFFVATIILTLAACAPQKQAVTSPSGYEPLLVPDMFYTSDGVALPYRDWLPKQKPRAVIVALHGFNDYSNAFSMPAVFFRAQGIAMYAYDQRGFGAGPNRGIWGGEENMINDLRQFVTAVKKQHPHTPLYLLGESMGGAVTIAALATPDFPSVDGVILSAPAVWGGDSMNDFYRITLWVVAHVAPFAEFTGEDLDILASNNIPMLRALSEDPLVLKSTRADAIYGLVSLMDKGYANVEKVQVPVLLLYGMCDQVIPSSPIREAVKRFKAPLTFAYYPGAYHMLLRDLAGDQIAQDVVHWIKNPRKVLPSGFTAQFVPEEDSLDLKSCHQLIHRVSGSQIRDEKGTE